MSRTERALWWVLAVAVGLIAVALVWRLFIEEPDCPPGFFYSHKHDRCVGSLEFDLGGGGLIAIVWPLIGIVVGMLGVGWLANRWVERHQRDP